MYISVDNIVNKISQIAEEISDKDLQTRMENLKKGFIHHNKLRITVIGQHFSELPEILMCLLEKPALFTRGAARTGSFTLEAFYSETEQYKIYMNGVDAYHVPQETFERSFSGKETGDAPLCAEVHTRSELLRLMDIHLVSSSRDFEDFDWVSIFAESDFVIFVLKADALLSVPEKRFIRETMQAWLEPGRYAFVVNHFDRVREDETEEVNQFIRAFLSQLAVSVPIYPFSTRIALECLKTGTSVPEPYTALLQMVQKELTDKTAEIHHKAIQKTMKSSVTMLTEAVERSKKGLAVDRNQLEVFIRTLHEKEQTIQKRMESLSRKLEIFITGSVKTDFQRKMDDFNVALVKSLKEDILNCGNPAEARKKLQPYLEYAWKTFFTNQEIWLKNSIFAEMSEIQKLIQKDMEQTLEGMDRELGTLLSDQFENRYSLTMYIAKKREKDTVSELTRYMNLGAFGLVLFNFPWALITLGVSQLLRFIFKDSITQGEREAMVKAAEEGCEKLKRQISAQNDAKFAEITAQLKKTKANSYQEMMTSILDMLEQKKAYAENAEAHLKKLEHIERQVIPELNAMLAQEQ